MNTNNPHLTVPLPVSRWWTRLENFLGTLYRLYERKPATTLATLPDTRHLQNRQVFRLNRTSKVSHLHVREGVVWLTRTPADGDVILRAGDRFDLGHGLPIVVQALQDSRVDLWS